MGANLLPDSMEDFLWIFSLWLLLPLSHGSPSLPAVYLGSELPAVLTQELLLLPLLN